MTIKKLMTDSLAFAEKDLQLALRFKVSFFAQTLLTPVMTALPFILVYAGYFFSGGTSLSNVSEQTFIAFILLGTVANIILRLGFNSYLYKFQQEKYWQTIDAIAIAPVNKMALILGGMIDGLVSVLPGIVIIFVVAGVAYPTSLLNVPLLAIIILFTLIISLCLGLIAGLASLFNENYSTVFQYSLVGIVFLSCFFYPISFFDNHPVLVLMKSLVLLNPYYHIVTMMRDLWFGSMVSPQSFLFVTAFVVAMPLISVAIFNWAWKHFTIEGY